jgi:hypothetical protein
VRIFAVNRCHTGSGGSKTRCEPELPCFRYHLLDVNEAAVMAIGSFIFADPGPDLRTNISIGAELYTAFASRFEDVGAKPPEIAFSNLWETAWRKKGA